MGIIYPQKVVVSASGGLYKHLLNLGYQAKYREKITVDVEHLMLNSNAIVWVKCDFCGDLFQRSFSHSNKLPKTACFKCKGNYTSATRVEMLTAKQQQYHDKNWLNHQYIDLKRTASDIAKECGVITQTIEAILIKYQIYKMPTYDEIKNLITKENLYDMYFEQKMSIREIVDKYPKIGTKTIKRLMYEYNIPFRTKSEISKSFWEKADVREKMSAIRKNLWNNKEYRSKTLVHLQDKNSIKKRAIRYSANHQGVTINQWKGFVTPKNMRIRGSVKYEEWRCAVFNRDNYTCQCCGTRSRIGNSVILHAHHLDSFASNEEKRFDVDNGLNLCNKCHDPRQVGSFHNMYGTSNNTRAQYQEYILLRNNTK